AANGITEAGRAFELPADAALATLDRFRQISLIDNRGSGQPRGKRLFSFRRDGAASLLRFRCEGLSYVLCFRRSCLEGGLDFPARLRNVLPRQPYVLFRPGSHKLGFGARSLCVGLRLFHTAPPF